MVEGGVGKEGGGGRRYRERRDEKYQTYMLGTLVPSLSLSCFRPSTGIARLTGIRLTRSSH